LANSESQILPGHGALAAWEIASVTSSVLIAEWILSAAAGAGKAVVAIPISLAFVLMIGSHLLRGESLRDLGFRLDNVFQALKLLLLPMLIIAIASLLIGFALGAKPNFLRWHPERWLVAQIGLGFAWGFVQQYVLQSFVNRRAQVIWGPGPMSILLTGLTFSLLHLPNPWLMVVTLIGGVIWAAVYQRAPNLFALAISHSVMTWVLVSTLPVSALNHLRIGFKYFS
jgi:membrane protease YdiL (CAAX protease family)